MMERIRDLGQQIGFAIVLAGFTEVIWHQPSVHPLVSALSYLMFGILFFDVIILTQSFHPLRGLVLAGVFGTLQASFISGNIGVGFPLSVALYASGISTLAFFATYLIFFQNEWWAWSFAGLTGLLSAFWVYGAPTTDLVEVTTQTPEFAPNLVFGLVGVGLGLGLNYWGQRQNNTPQSLILTRPFLVIISILGLGLAVYQFTSENLSALTFMVALVMLIVLPLMYWFMYLNKLYTQTLTAPTQPIWHAGLSILFLGIAHGVGYALSDRFPMVGDGVILALILFGSSWLPLLSASLGFEAFVQLADEGIL